MKLDLNNKTCIRPVTLGIEFCGYKTWATHIKLRKSTALKMKRRLKLIQERYALGQITLERAMQTVNSYMGILKHCNSYALRKAIFGGYDEDTSNWANGWFLLKRGNEEVPVLWPESELKE